MPIKGKALYPLRWYWRADIGSAAPLICNTKNVATTTPALPDPPVATAKTAFGPQPVIAAQAP